MFTNPATQHPRTFYLFWAPNGEYFLLELEKNDGTHVLFAAYDGHDNEWASAQSSGTPIVFQKEEDMYGLDDAYHMHTPYVKVDVWEKYYFPSFTGDGTPKSAGDYQLYNTGQIDAMAAVIKECIRLAGELGIVLGSR